MHNNLKIKYNPIILAVDLSNFDQVVEVLSQTHHTIGMAKFGLEFFYHFGIDGLKKINQIFPDLKIFLDLKFYDIPNTVCRSLYALKDIKNIFFLTFHAQGGQEMLEKMLYTINQVNPEINLLAVTKLTSFNLEKQQVLDLAEMVINSGVQGIVCPASMSTPIKEKFFDKKFFVVSPGIRLQDQNIKLDDQKAFLGPREAMLNGVDYMVIGRPIMDSNDRLGVINKILEQIA